MKKKRLRWMLLFILLIILAACSQQREKEVEIPEFLDVQLSVNPEQGNVNESITFEAKVMYGDKEVTDPDNVEFEIWRAHDEDHVTVEVENKGNGVYEYIKSFSIEGTYYIYAHVTAENMHNMPKKEFVIGQPSEPEDGGASAVMEETESSEHTDK